MDTGAKTGLNSAMAKRIVYYHGCFVNYFDHETGMAVVKALENNGFNVEVPEIICCGFPLLNSGNIGAGEKRAAALVEALEGFAREECDIVYSCPTCGYALKEVYPYLLESEAARLVAEKAHPITAYLLRLHEQGRLNVEFALLTRIQKGQKNYRNDDFFAPGSYRF